MTATPDLPPRFKYVRELGRGGMATVYLVFDTELGHEVALKKLSEDFSNDESTKERFRREFAATSAFSHPNIAKVYDLIEKETGEIYIAFEFVAGRTLHAILKDDSSALTVKAKLGIALQLARALSHAHSKGVIHRDIKPSNIMLTADGTVKLLDFGISRRDSDEGLTRTGEICGTLVYVAPEQILRKQLDCRTDVYAFGILLFELLALRAPFNSKHQMHLAHCHLMEPPPKIRSYARDVPRWVELMIDTCLEKKPEDRYQKMDDVIKIIERHTTRAFTFTLFDRVMALLDHINFASQSSAKSQVSLKKSLP